jgi:RNA polymerase primary sigma factor
MAISSNGGLSLSAANYERYLQDIKRYPILPNDKIINLIRQSRNYKGGTRESRKEARNQILMANQRLVISIALPFARKRLGTLNDLVQEGTIGMMSAIRKFKLRSKNQFSTYATWWIRQAIMRSISGLSRTIYVPPNRVDLIGRLRKFQEFWLVGHGRWPTVEEVAEHFGFSPRRAASLISDSRQEEVFHLEELNVAARGETLDDIIVDDRTEPIEIRLENDFLAEALNRSLANLRPAYRLIMEYYFGLNGRTQLNFTEIGKKLGCSRQLVQNKHKKTLLWLSEKHPELRQYFERL